MAMRQCDESEPILRSYRSRSSRSPRLRRVGKNRRHGRLAATTLCPSPTARVNCWRKFGSTYLNSPVRLLHCICRHRANPGRPCEGCSYPYLFRWWSLREPWTCEAWPCSFSWQAPAHSESRWGRERGRSIPFATFRWAAELGRYQSRADMAQLAAGSTRSRMTQSDTSRPSIDASQKDHSILILDACHTASNESRRLRFMACGLQPLVPLPAIHTRSCEPA